MLHLGSAGVPLEGAEAPSEEWPFMMVNREDFLAVSRHLAASSKRRLVAVMLWNTVLAYCNGKTGELEMTRPQLAAALGVSTRIVSTVFAELLACGAMTREYTPVPGWKGPGVATYRLNPRIATELPLKLRELAQASAPALDLSRATARSRPVRVSAELPTERRARAPSPASLVV